MPEKTRAVPPSKRSAFSTSLRIVPPTELTAELQPLRDAIARRAYEIFESNGRVAGKDLENWLRAESELLLPVPVHVAGGEDSLTVIVELLGFAADQLRVSIDQRRLTIAGKGENTAGAGKGKAVQILRMVDLPPGFDLEQLSARVTEGVLQVTAPKIPVAASAIAMKPRKAEVASRLAARPPEREIAG